MVSEGNRSATELNDLGGLLLQPRIVLLSLRVLKPLTRLKGALSLAMWASTGIKAFTNDAHHILSQFFSTVKRKKAGVNMDKYKQ